MNIWVTSLDDLHITIGGVNATHVLTLIDQDVKVTYPEGVQTMRLNMWDVESTESALYPGVELTGDGIPTMEHVYEIINFANSIDKKNDRVVVHCWAGVSRSTAAALIILYILYDKDIKRAIDKLLEIRPQAAPNKLLCKYADIILNEGKAVLLREALKIDDRYLINKGY